MTTWVGPVAILLTVGERDPRVRAHACASLNFEITVTLALLVGAATLPWGVGAVIMATLIGMALGGWLSGWIFDVTGSYRAAFLNGIGWNLLNLAIAGTLYWRQRQLPARSVQPSGA